MNVSLVKESTVGATAMLAKVLVWPDGHWVFRDEFDESILLTRSDDFYETSAVYDDELNDWIVID